MKILLYTFINFGGFESGSMVRPQMMHAAFREAGAEVVLLQTQQNRKAERRQAVAEMSRWLGGNSVDLCYVESPSGVILNRCDRKLLKRIRRLGIPMAVFYRDAYFLLPVSEREKKTRLQNILLDILCRLDLRLYRKIADIVYFPSESMAELFRFKSKDILPPAANENFQPHKSGGKNCIYVGGLGDRYGTDILLKAFALLNKSPSECYHLTIVCRKAEQGSIPGEYLVKQWLTVLNASGSASLSVLYRDAGVALYPVRRSRYIDFAVSVKLYEYMGYGLPIVTTDCVEAAKLVSGNKIGAVTQDNPESFANGIRQILSDGEAYSSTLENVRLAVANGNLWIHRAKKVLEDLRPAD
jgi:glycosyltransferase involved in cell wall biosynthesis